MGAWRTSNAAKLQQPRISKYTRNSLCSSQRKQSPVIAFLPFADDADDAAFAGARRLCTDSRGSRSSVLLGVLIGGVLEVVPWSFVLCSHTTRDVSATKFLKSSGTQASVLTSLLARETAGWGNRGCRRPISGDERAATRPGSPFLLLLHLSI